ncbi:MAG TPA: hypothetical protein V6C65_09390 [Allocoleopsis sp.]
MATITALKAAHNTNIRVKAAAGSIDTDDVADLLDGLADELKARGIAYLSSYNDISLVDPDDYDFVFIQNLGLYYHSDTGTPDNRNVMVGSAGYWILMHDVGKAVRILGTTDATPGTIHDFATLSGKVYEIEFTVVASNTSGSEIAIFKKLTRYKNIAGTLSALGSTQDIGSTYQSAGFSTTDVAVTTSTTNIRVQVTGVAATNISWKMLAVVREHEI